jgi:hypothetical protein
MKQLLLFLSILTFSVSYAVDNNVELITNSDFAGASLVSQAAILATDASGAWIAGDNTKTAFTPTVEGAASTAYFKATAASSAVNIYDHFLGQITNEVLNSGCYRLSLKAKGAQPFYLKLSTINLVGAELPFVLKNIVATSPATIDNSGTGGYSIKFTPSADWSTLQTDIDLTIAEANKMRLFFVFPTAGEISLDDISLVRLGDIVVYDNYYLRPNGDNTSWNNLTGIHPDQIIEASNFSFAVNKNYYLAPGTYTSGGTITLNSGKIFGGFSGNETTIDLSARALSDKDGNGSIEPWEFTNEAIITTNIESAKFTGAGTNTFRLLVVSGTGAEVNGVTLTNFFYTTYAGPITLGKSATTPAAADNIESLAGVMRFCTVRKIKTNSTGGAVMLTNQYSLVDQCLIEENVSLVGNSGGGVFMHLFGGKVTGSVIRNNASAGTNGRGGGVYASTSAATGDLNAIVENCVIYNNVATNGGGLRVDAQTGKRGIQVVNSTIVNNKTTGNTASVEFINSGFIVNSIVVNPSLAEGGTEIRCHAANHYFTNTIYGDSTYTAGGTKAANLRAMITDDLKFLNPTTFTGVMIPDHTTPFVQDSYDAIKQANYKINPTLAAESPAITHASLKTLPATYTFTTGTIGITAAVPSIDLTGLDRPLATSAHLDLGAYQLSGINTSATAPITGRFYCVSTENGVQVNNAENLNIQVYALSGQLVKRVHSTTETAGITLDRGVYIIKSEKFVEKVIVK